MFRSRRSYFAVLLGACLALTGCDSDSPSEPEDPDGSGESSTGSIFVTVSRSGGQAVAGATVLTSPDSGRHTTSATGTVLISDLEPGTYVVTATQASIGSGNGAVQVISEDVKTIPVVLVDGVFLQPMVTILAPFAGEEFSYVEPVSLRAAVSDDLDSAEDISIVWSSDVDGELSTDPANPSGLSEVDLSPLSMGTHVISLVATDSDGFEGSALVTVSVRSFFPEVSIESPAAGFGVVPGETIEFSATVGDRETPAEQLDVAWTSDLDGELNTDAPDASGSLGFSSDELSRGLHQITLSVLDGDDNRTEATVAVGNNLPQRVVLAALEKDAGGIQLSWATVDEPDFESFRIYRSTSEEGTYELIQILNDAEATGYRDTDVMFGRTYWYRVGLRTTLGPESESNRQSIEAGISINVGTQVESMLVDPTRPYIYAIDRVNNSMLFINLETKSVEKTIFVGSSPTDLDINGSATEVFIANYGSTQIAVVDLETQEVDRNLSVDTNAGTWDGNPYWIACVGSNELAYTSWDQWNNIKLVDRSTGALLDVKGSVHSPSLIASPDDSRIYIENLERWDVADQTLTLADTGSGTGGRVIAVSGDGTVVVKGTKKLLANNLGSDLGTFGETIYLVSHDASFAVGRQSVYDGNSFAVLGAVPVSTTTMAFSSDESLVYLYDTSTSRIFLFEVSGF